MLMLAAVMIGASIFNRPEVTKAAWQLNLLMIPGVAFLAWTGNGSWYALSPVLGGFMINTGIVMCRGHVMTAMIAAGEVLWVLTGLLFHSAPAVMANLINIGALAVRTTWSLVHRYRIP